MSSQFQKMVLIPENASAQMYSTIKSVKSHQTRLDNEMEEIVKRTDLSTEEKWKMYQQALHRYLNYTPQLQKPVVLPVYNSQSSNMVPMIQYIISSVPKSFAKKTQVLLNLLQASNRITWDETGVVTVDNKVIPGTNIIDLINDVVRTRKTSKNPIGIQEFKELLQNINIPLELINFQYGAGFIKVNNKKKNTNRKKRFSSLFKNYKEYKF